MALAAVGVFVVGLVTMAVAPGPVGGHRTVRQQGGPRRRHGPDVGVCTSTAMAGVHWPSDTSSLKSVQVSTPAACETVCCETMGCGHWAFTTSEPAGRSACLTGGPCCWLKGGVPAFPTAPNVNCTVGVLTSIPNSTSTVRYGLPPPRMLCPDAPVVSTECARQTPRCASPRRMDPHTHTRAHTAWAAALLTHTCLSTPPCALRC